MSSSDRTLALSLDGESCLGRAWTGRASGSLSHITSRRIRLRTRIVVRLTQRARPVPRHTPPGWAAKARVLAPGAPVLFPAGSAITSRSIALSPGGRWIRGTLTNRSTPRHWMGIARGGTIRPEQTLRINRTSAVVRRTITATKCGTLGCTSLRRWPISQRTRRNRARGTSLRRSLFSCTSTKARSLPGSSLRRASA